MKIRIRLFLEAPIATFGNHGGEFATLKRKNCFFTFVLRWLSLCSPVVESFLFENLRFQASFFMTANAETNPRRPRVTKRERQSAADLPLRPLKKLEKDEISNFLTEKVHIYIYILCYIFVDSFCESHFCGIF